MTATPMQDYVIVVNAADEEVGREEKLEAHRTPVLHRAFSVFVLDAQGSMLLQQRAGGKYHSAGLWSNACCGHPRPGEAVVAAAQRRLREEMGITCPLAAAGTIAYAIDVGGGLREHEFNHVMCGVYDGGAMPDPAEVSGWEWIAPSALRARLREAPTAFTPWFGVVLGRLERWLATSPAAVSPDALRAWRSAA